MIKRKILVSFYGDIQGYPPTLNMINVLVKNGYKVIVICRNAKELNGIIDKSVKLITVFNDVSIQRQMTGTILLKIKLYLTFLIKHICLIKKVKPDVVLIYDPIAFVFNCISYFFVKKRQIHWYHNHDVFETGEKKGLKEKFFYFFEKYGFKRIDYFTLPSVERLIYFPINLLTGKHFVIPNYPSIDLYNHFFKSRKFSFVKFNIIFQGSIGEGHGLEEIIPALGWNESIKKNVFLHLKGKISDSYKTILIKIACSHLKKEYLVFHDYSSYLEVPKLASECQLGVAIFTKKDIMNKTLGTASNKIYEYAAVGTPILYFADPHYEEYLSKYEWAFVCDLSKQNIQSIIEKIDKNFKFFSESAFESFKNRNNFEIHSRSIIDDMGNKIDDLNINRHFQ